MSLAVAPGIIHHPTAHSTCKSPQTDTEGSGRAPGRPPQEPRDAFVFASRVAIARVRLGVVAGLTTLPIQFLCQRPNWLVYIVAGKKSST